MRPRLARPRFRHGAYRSKRPAPGVGHTWRVNHETNRCCRFRRGLLLGLLPLHRIPDPLPRRRRRAQERESRRRAAGRSCHVRRHRARPAVRAPAQHDGASALQAGDARRDPAVARARPLRADLRPGSRRGPMALASNPGGPLGCRRHGPRAADPRRLRARVGPRRGRHVRPRPRARARAGAAPCLGAAECALESGRSPCGALPDRAAPDDGGDDVGALVHAAHDARSPAVRGHHDAVLHGRHALRGA
jgi:hypothetical protein